MKILNLIENSNHCTESKGVISCNVCNSEIKTLRTKQTFQNHFVTAYGFVELHRIKCLKNAKETNNSPNSSVF